MTSHEPPNLIDKLPDKVLGEIFNYLDKDEVKDASLVCKRWNQIIFHTSYIERFQLMLYEGKIRFRESEMSETIQPSLAITSTRSERQMKRKIQQQIRRQALNEMLQSPRCYRNIFYDISYNFVLQALPPQKLHQLQSLTVVLDTRDFVSFDLWITLANAIPLMKQLNTLYLECYGSERVGAGLPVKSVSVRHLTVERHFPIVADMPALETYEGPLDNLHWLGPNMPRNQLDKIRKLTLEQSESSVKFTIDDYREFFRRLPNIQIIANDYYEPENDLFIAMCESCSSLQELKWRTSDSNSFNLLSNLTNLRRIEFKRSNAPATASLDLSKLLNLEHLNLGAISAKRSFFHNLPQSITKLELTITSQNERSLLRAITSSMTQLKELIIELSNHFNEPDYAPTITLRLLPLLIRLEMFEFQGGFFGESCLLHMNTPMHRLRKLDFSWSKLDTKQLKGLHEKFPKLKEVAFKYCHLTSGDSIGVEYERYR